MRSSRPRTSGNQPAPRPDLRPPRARLAFGARAGLGIGACFAVLAALRLVLTGGHRGGQSDAGLTAPAVAAEYFAVYFLAVPAAGAVFGLLLPWMRSISGAAAVGTAVTVAAGLMIAAWRGTFPRGGVLAVFMMCAILIGHIVGLIVREYALVRWADD